MNRITPHVSNSEKQMPQVVTSCGCVIDQDPERFGRFHDSTLEVNSPGVLRSRLQEQGYLFFRGLLDTEILFRARQSIVGELIRRDMLDSNVTSSACQFPVRGSSKAASVLEDLGRQSTELHLISRQKALESLFSAIFEEDAAALHYVWPRAVRPGRGALPHCDWVYMGRGSERILSAWIPLMDVPIRLGPLMILEDSHRENPHTRSYLKMDSDRLGILEGLRIKHSRIHWGAGYSRSPDRVRDEFGTRWLTMDFELGDVVIFSTRCVHAALDNRTNGFRLSVDLRFQPAAEPMDLRFAGSDLAVHKNREMSILDGLRYLKRALSGHNRGMQ